MRGYIIRRVLQVILTFFLFLTVSYFILDAMPGDFGDAFLSNPRMTQDQKQALRQFFGLDRPPIERFFVYMGSLLRGNLGISFSNYPQSVVSVIIERAPRTIMLFLTATVLSFYIGFFVGKILAWRRGRGLEYITTIGGVTLYTVFTPWFGLMMIWLFGFTLHWFPIGKFIDPVLWRKAPDDIDANLLFNRMLFTAIIASLVLFVALQVIRRIDYRWRLFAQLGAFAAVIAGVLLYWIPTNLMPYVLDILHHLVLPVMTLTLISFAGTMLLTRNSMLETLREDYIMAARAKGLPERVIRDRHAARNAMLPVVTALVFSLASTIGGGVITETIFSWPGMGLALLNAATTQDIPMTMGGLVFVGSLALLAHLAADILYAFLDPRIRYA